MNTNTHKHLEKFWVDFFNSFTHDIWNTQIHIFIWAVFFGKGIVLHEMFHHHIVFNFSTQKKALCLLCHLTLLSLSLESTDKSKYSMSIWANPTKPPTKNFLPLPTCCLELYPIYHRINILNKRNFYDENTKISVIIMTIWNEHYDRKTTKYQWELSLLDNEHFNTHAF